MAPFLKEQDAIARLEDKSKEEDSKMSRVQQQEPLRFPQNVFTFCHFLLGKSVRQKEKEMEERRKALEEEKNTLTAGASKILVGFNFFPLSFPSISSVVNGIFFCGSCISATRL